MKTVRYCTFETNSSSCHSITHISKEELKNWSANRHSMCIWLPDCEGYTESAIGHEYKIMDLRDAMLKYNTTISDYDNRMEETHKEYPDWDGYNYRETFKKYFDEDEFYDDMENDILEHDGLFGRYMTFNNFFVMAIIENNMTFDIQWWNND